MAISGVIEGLVGSPYNDVLIAGGGPATLLASWWPSRGGIVIGGGTAYDANDQALRAVLAEWASNRPLAPRVRNLTGGSGSKDRRNGAYFLNAQTVQPRAA